MSLGEFLYPVLQSWDWWHLYDKMGIQVQIGGSDQYGNILTGIDAIKHINMRDDGSSSSKAKRNFLSTPMGLTVPLLKSASGEKFGKSLGNAIWLDSDMTSIFELYQVCQIIVSLFCPFANVNPSSFFALPTRMLAATSNCSRSCRLERLRKWWKITKCSRRNALLNTN